MKYLFGRLKIDFQVYCEKYTTITIMELFSINDSCNIMRAGSKTKVKMDFFDTSQYFVC